MARKDWTYINLPNLIAKRLDQFLKSDSAKEMGVYSKSELLRKITTEFLEEQESHFNSIQSIPEFIGQMVERDHIVLTHKNDEELIEILMAFIERGQQKNLVNILGILKEEEQRFVELLKKCDIKIDDLFNEQDVVFVFNDDCIKGEFTVQPLLEDLKILTESAKRRNKNGFSILSTLPHNLIKQKRYDDVLIDEQEAHRLVEMSELPLSIICLYKDIPSRILRHIEKFHDVIIKQTITKTGLQ